MMTVGRMDSGGIIKQLIIKDEAYGGLGLLNKKLQCA